MGNLGIPELLILVVVVLLIFGPSKLPEVGKSIGKAMGEFRRGLRDGFDDKDVSKSDSHTPPSPKQLN